MDVLRVPAESSLSWSNGARWTDSEFALSSTVSLTWSPSSVPFFTCTVRAVSCEVALALDDELGMMDESDVPISEGCWDGVPSIKVTTLDN